MESKEYKGKCYYCKKGVFHEKPHDYCAYTKKWNNDLQKYELSNFFHMDCYIERMKRMTSRKVEEEYTQLSFF